MGWRVPPNKGIIEFPVKINARVTTEQHAFIARQGGGAFLRFLIGDAITASARPTPLLNAKKTGHGRRTRRPYTKRKKVRVK